MISPGEGSERFITFRLQIENDRNNTRAFDDLKKQAAGVQRDISGAAGDALFEATKNASEALKGLNDAQKQATMLRERVENATRAAADGFATAANSSLRFGRAIALSSAASEKDLKKVLDVLVDFELAVSGFNAVVDTTKAATRAFAAYRTATEAAAAANAVFTASEQTKAAALGLAAAGVAVGRPVATPAQISALTGSGGAVASGVGSAVGAGTATGIGSAAGTGIAFGAGKLVAGIGAGTIGGLPGLGIATALGLGLGATFLGRGIGNTGFGRGLFASDIDTRQGDVNALIRQQAFEDRLFGLNVQQRQRGIADRTQSLRDQLSFSRSPRQSLAIAQGFLGQANTAQERVTAFQEILRLQEQITSAQRQSDREALQSKQQQLDLLKSQRTEIENTIQRQRDAQASAAERFANLDPIQRQRVLGLSAAPAGGDRLNVNQLNQLAGFRQLGRIDDILRRQFEDIAFQRGFGGLLDASGAGQQLRELRGQLGQNQIQINNQIEIVQDERNIQQTREEVRRQLEDTTLRRLEQQLRELREQQRIERERFEAIEARRAALQGTRQ